MKVSERGECWCFFNRNSVWQEMLSYPHSSNVSEMAMLMTRNNKYRGHMTVFVVGKRIYVINSKGKRAVPHEWRIPERLHSQGIISIADMIGSQPLK